MAKLHQVLAVEKGQKTTAHRRLTDIYQQLQKPALLEGLSRTYRPRSDDGEMLPAQNNQVTVKVPKLLAEIRSITERWWDTALTKEVGNTLAVADIKVDGQTLLVGVPATYLLWLEHQLTELHTQISKLPTLDPSEKWTWSPEQDCYATEESETHRSKKNPRVLVKAEATDKHPAQTEVWYEDEIVGYWKVIKYSGALPATTVREMTERVEKLQEATRVALAEANSTEVQDQRATFALMDYVFGGLNR